jgi:hypothetical protein
VPFTPRIRWWRQPGAWATSRYSSHVARIPERATHTRRHSRSPTRLLRSARVRIANRRPLQLLRYRRLRCRLGCAGCTWRVRTQVGGELNSLALTSQYDDPSTSYDAQAHWITARLALKVGGEGETVEP